MTANKGSAPMIDPNLIGALQKDHQKLLLTKEEAASFLSDPAALCRQHHVLLRTSDGMIRFSKSFEKIQYTDDLQNAR